LRIIALGALSGGCTVAVQWLYGCCTVALRWLGVGNMQVL